MKKLLVLFFSVFLLCCNQSKNNKYPNIIENKINQDSINQVKIEKEQVKQDSINTLFLDNLPFPNSMVSETVFNHSSLCCSSPEETKKTIYYSKIRGQRSSYEIVKTGDYYKVFQKLKRNEFESFYSINKAESYIQDRLYNGRRECNAAQILFNKEKYNLGNFAFSDLKNMLKSKGMLDLEE